MFFQRLPGYLGGWKRLKQPMGNSFHDVNRHPSFRFSFFRLNISRLMGKSTPKKTNGPCKNGKPTPNILLEIRSTAKYRNVLQIFPPILRENMQLNM
jgi:hypothetical protein